MTKLGDIVSKDKIINAMDSREDYVSDDGRVGYNGKSNAMCLGEILSKININNIAEVISKLEVGSGD